MPNPSAGGKIMQYEEVWRELDWSPGIVGGTNWILESADDGRGSKTFMAKLGKYLLGAMRAGSERQPSFSALRLGLDVQSNIWKVVYAIGEMKELHEHFEHIRAIDDDLDVGRTITVGKATYIVRAKSRE